MKIDFDYDNIYNILFKTQDKYSEKIKENWGKYYTKDKSFLKKYTKMIKKWDISFDNTIVNNAYNIINDFDNEESFLNRYNYININLLKPFNQNIHILQAISTYKLMSPVLSLMLPIFRINIPIYSNEIKRNRYFSRKLYKFIKINRFKIFSWKNFHRLFISKFWKKSLYCI